MVEERGDGTVAAVLRNLTPHPVRLLGAEPGDGPAVELPPDGPPARLVLAPDEADGAVRVGDLVVPLVRTAATAEVTGLPEPRPGVLLIVARSAAEAFPDRDDLCYPHRMVRDGGGAVVGCRALGRPAAKADPRKIHNF